MSTTSETDTRPEPVSHRAGQHQDTAGQTGSTARTPVAAAAAAPLGVVFAVALGALGVVGVRDGLVAAGALGGHPGSPRRSRT